MTDHGEPNKPDGCMCPYRWVDTLGVLYGVKMMGGWVRVRDAPECEVHGG